MAMRPRTASGIIRGGRPPIRPVYEDFRPFSEWKQEQGADIVLVHLPGNFLYFYRHLSRINMLIYAIFLDGLSFLLCMN